MSLLHRGTDQVTVFADAARTDSDGNTITQPLLLSLVNTVGRTASNGRSANFLLAAAHRSPHARHSSRART
nr:hypothetical protein CPGR_04974 [Mycolicibacterium komanii]